MSRIFINYRRGDTPAHASRLQEWLSDHYGKEHVFKDVDAIEPGLDFEEAIEKAIGESDVLLALIGRQWVVDADGRKRLEDPDDFVRKEIEAALDRNIRVIPVLVEGATMPTPEELPPSLVRLTRRHAFELSDTRWRFDKEELLQALDRVLAVPEEEPSPTPAAAPVGQSAETPTPVVTAAAPAPVVPAAPTPEDPAKSAVKWGWIFAGASLLFFGFAIGAIVCGARVISRSEGRRTVMGVAIIVVAIFVGLVNLSFYFA